ncbi:unnamed protein product [Rotaria sordida]|uniref:NAD(P)(+)--arginine ADP-ribosyltransferase n=1 Tax=Rotaria sordida TaxID=392033 RepID=A0A815DL83_9BILA|nr:unnamed protein product [Rotaria sordida]CAF1494216.1 unnamed protein product [Rotaria sordida]CAF4057845.1 unnamed protein product [Rotaria sordida]
MYESSRNPREWRSYSDIETAIIEEQYQKKQPEALLDDYRVNFKHFIQLSNHNEKDQCPVRHIIKRRTDNRLREARFMPDPVLLSQSFTDARHRASFLDTAGQFFNLSVATPSNGIPQDTLVERAAEDIVIEAREVRKEKEGKWMAEQLLKVKDKNLHEIAKCCARLYCMESFLYKKMNEIMRIGIDETYQALWQNKLSTFGPFAILLFNSQRTLALPAAAKNTTVYCGVNLSSEQIEQYRRITSLPEANRKCDQFRAFTSTSRNKEKAQEFGNVLFVIEIAEVDGCDVSLYSEFDEEEYLLEPRFYFSIKSCLFDNTINKWITILRPLNR